MVSWRIYWWVAVGGWFFPIKIKAGSIPIFYLFTVYIRSRETEIAKTQNVKYKQLSLITQEYVILGYVLQLLTLCFCLKLLTCTLIVFKGAMQCIGSLITFCMLVNNVLRVIWIVLKENGDISVKHGSCSCWSQSYAGDYMCRATIIATV